MRKFSLNVSSGVWEKPFFKVSGVIFEIFRKLEFLIFHDNNAILIFWYFVYFLFKILVMFFHFTNCKWIVFWKCSFWSMLSLEMPVPSQGHYGFHNFLVVDWFCLFINLWVLTFLCKIVRSSVILLLPLFKQLGIKHFACKYI